MIIQSHSNTTRAYRRLSLAALAYLLPGQRAIIVMLLPNTHSVISGHFPRRWSHASTYICKAETLAFTDCVYCQCCKCSLCHMYMRSRKSCSETRRKFQVNFPGGPLPNPSTIRRQAKIFKETGFVKNRKVNHRRHVFKEETLDEIGERLEHTPQKIS